jgi:hypothetical protein
MIYRPLRPSISTLVRRFVPMIGSTMSEHLPSCRMLHGWSDRSKVMAESDNQRDAGIAGLAA